METRNGLRVGVALGGGAARGLAHLGVLKALDRERISISALSGVSVGSVVAAGYAAGLPLDELMRHASKVSWKDLGSFSLSFRGMQSTDRMGEWLARVLPVRTFEELRIPLRLVATDLRTGAARVFDSGDLFTAIRASCAIPGLYVPVELNGSLLADGYLSCAVPTRQLRDAGMDVVIGSSIGLEVSENLKLNNAYRILMRSFSILSSHVQRTDHGDADVVIEPEVQRYAWDDMSAVDQLVEAGEVATRAKRDEIAALVNPTLLSRLARRYAR